MTALHWATEHHHRDVVELLIKYGADVHAFSKFDKSAFDIALEKNNPEILVMLQVWFLIFRKVRFSLETILRELNFPHFIKIALLSRFNHVTLC